MSAKTMADYGAEAAAKPVARSYGPEDVQRALNALIAFGGSPTLASRALAETYELDIPVTTLKSWRDHTHAEDYVALQKQHGAAIEDAMVREVRDLARTATMAERLAVEKVVEEMSKPNSRLDPATVALNMSKVKASNIDKLLTLTGRPAAITEHRSAMELIRALEAKGVVKALPA